MQHVLRYTVLLFLVTGCVCVPNPLQFNNGYSSNVPDYGDKKSFIEEKTVQGLLEKCPDDPTIKWKIRDALQNLDNCVKSTMVDTAILSEGPSGLGNPEQVRQKAKNVCRIYKGMQPCIHDTLTAIKMCEPNLPVDDVVSAYEAAVSVACVNDGAKLAAAITEINSIRGPMCQRRILSDLETCLDEVKAGSGRTITVCRKMDCMQKATNQCGGPKKIFNELINDVRVAIDQYVPCMTREHYAQLASNGQSVQFSPNLFLSIVSVVGLYTSRSLRLF